MGDCSAAIRPFRPVSDAEVRCAGDHDEGVHSGVLRDYAYPLVDGKPATQVTHLVLEHVRRIEPVPAKGALGLWRPDEDLAVEIAHRLVDLVTWDLPGARSVADAGDVLQLWSLVCDEVPVA